MFTRSVVERFWPLLRSGALVYVLEKWWCALAQNPCLAYIEHMSVLCLDCFECVANFVFSWNDDNSLLHTI